MTELFKKKPDAERRTERREIRMTKKEAEAIEASARARNLDVTQFILRAALGRRADVRYETEIVLALRDVVKALKTLHKAVVDRGLVPPEAEWRPVIKEAVAAMLRISK